MGRSMWMWVVVALLVLAVVTMQGGGGKNGRSREMSYSDFLDNVQQRRVKSVVIEKETGAIRGDFQVSGQSASGRDSQTFVTNAHPRSIPELEQTLRDAKVTFSYEAPGIWRDIFPFLMWALIFALFFYFFFYRQMRGGGGGMLSFGKSRAVRITSEKNKKTFADVAGIDEAKEEVEEIIEFLKNPAKFQRLGGRLPKGVLLIGSPGTGKTLLAKAIAGEANVPFFSISGSDFVEMFVGVGASRVRDLFEQAKANSPCIIFLDEIDAVGRKRANDLPGSGIETAQTLNAILVEMDGFQSDDNVIVIAATNRPDVLDPALLRPGRFDRRIYVDAPDVRGREQILAVHAKGVKLADDVELSIIARGTPTFSGADLENLVNEAALIAVMRNKNTVDMECFEEARDKVRFGKEKRSRLMDEEDRRTTAYHEAGHALLMRLVPHVTPLHKVTIIPRGRALGATMQLPEKDEYNMGKKRILGEITVRLGGRVAEELFLSDITNGAAMDLQQSTSFAKGMVCEWGMTEALGLPYLSESDRGEGEFFVAGKPYSEDTAKRVDVEVRRILDNCYTEAKELLSKHREDMELLVAGLMEYEMLTRDDIELILTERSLEPLREAKRIGAAANRWDPTAKEEIKTATGSKIDVVVPDTDQAKPTDSTPSENVPPATPPAAPTEAVDGQAEK